MLHQTAPDDACFKSVYRSENGTACVEVANLTRTTGQVGIRDSKSRQGPELALSAYGFSAFLSHLRHGHLST